MNPLMNALDPAMAYQGFSQQMNIICCLTQWFASLKILTYNTLSVPFKIRTLSVNEFSLKVFL